MDSYEKLLEKAKSSLPEIKQSSERFEMPKAVGHVQGNKTIISNFSAIVKTFNRDQSHFLKYLLRELASPGNVDGPRLILGRKISSGLINDKIEEYAREFVLCHVCRKPDTILKKEERITMMKCSACGAKSPVRTKI
ncbi:MAG: translation initiation factor IF-2 subunit beta [Nanoarchaeota archaeon]